MFYTQTLIQKKSKNMKVEITGKLAPVTAKDITLSVIGKTGTAGGTGYVIEYTGEAIRDLSMEGRMTVCNMSIEGGARAGLIAPDQKTFDYCKGRPHAPKGPHGKRQSPIGKRSLATRVHILTKWSPSVVKTSHRL